MAPVSRATGPRQFPLRPYSHEHITNLGLGTPSAWNRRITIAEAIQNPRATGTTRSPRPPALKPT
jgi:hypothetical protein